MKKLLYFIFLIFSWEGLSRSEFDQGNSSAHLDVPSYIVVRDVENVVLAYNPTLSRKMNVGYVGGVYEGGDDIYVDSNVSYSFNVSEFTGFYDHEGTPLGSNNKLTLSSKDIYNKMVTASDNDEFDVNPAYGIVQKNSDLDRKRVSTVENEKFIINITSVLLKDRSSGLYQGRYIITVFMTPKS